MPEPTDVDPIDAIRERLQRMQAGGHYSREQQVHDYGTLLAAYDQWQRDTNALCIAVSDQSKRAHDAEATLAETRQALAEVEHDWGRRDLAAWEAKDRALAAAEARAAAAEAAVQRVLDECDLGEFQARRWADPFPVPQWVEDVRAAVTGTITPDGGERINARLFRDQRAEVWDEIKARRAPLAGPEVELLRPADPTHHYPVRDLSGEPLPADLDWTAAEEANWLWRRAEDFPLSAYVPDEDGAPVSEEKPTSALCRRCHRAPATAGPDGRFCPDCISRCHESTDFAHECAVCQSPLTPVAASQFISGFQAATHAIEQDGPR